MSIKEKIFFKNGDLRVAGELYLPIKFDKTKKYAAVIAVHPGNGVKEQVSGLYAKLLAEQGFVTLAYDASRQGESEGYPRYLEDPAHRVEDIRCAIDFLVTLPYVDEERIGAFGICAGGGYAISCAQSEARIKAVAGISTWDVGDSQRNGLFRSLTREERQQLLRDVSAQRTREARGEEPLYMGYVPASPAEFKEDTAQISKDASDYYCTPRAGHPNSHNKYLFSCNDRMIAWDAFSLIDTISPRPILFIVGEIADTIYFTDTAYEKALEPKEIYRVKGAKHVDLYDLEPFVSEVAGKLTSFFTSNL